MSGGTKGLFRNDLERVAVVMVAGKFGIKVEYKSGENELLHQAFDTAQEAQKAMDERLKAKNV